MKLLLSLSIVVLLICIACKKPDCVHSVTGEYKSALSIDYTNAYGVIDTVENIVSKDLQVKRVRGGVRIRLEEFEKDFKVKNCAGYLTDPATGESDGSYANVTFTPDSMFLEFVSYSEWFHTNTTVYHCKKL